MGRLVRISIYALIILILYFWVTAILKSYQKGKPVDDTALILSDTLVKDSLLQDTSMQSFSDEAELLSNEDIVDGKINYDVLDEKVKKLEDKEKNTAQEKELVSREVSAPKPQEKPSIKPKSAIDRPKEEKLNRSTGVKINGGPYMVMAGSYLLKENALKMVKKLQALGYPNPEVIVFKASEYYSVVAERHTSESSAKSAAGELKRKGVDSFVKK